MKIVLKYILVVLAVSVIPTAIVIVLWLLTFGGFPIIEVVRFPAMTAINFVFIIFGMFAAAEIVDN